MTLCIGRVPLEFHYLFIYIVKHFRVLKQHRHLAGTTSPLTAISIYKPGYYRHINDGLIVARECLLTMDLFYMLEEVHCCDIMLICFHLYPKRMQWATIIISLLYLFRFPF